MGTCGGEEFAAFTGCATLSSYLVLFISFYAATYRKATKKQKRSVASATTEIPRKAAIDLKNIKVPTASETTDAATEVLHKAEDLVLAAGTHVQDLTQDLSFTGGKHN